MKKESLWQATSASITYPALQDRLNVDALVVGGGITGLTTAYLLKKSGCSVAVVDHQEIGGGETAHTTAHLTFVTDARLKDLVSEVGRDDARLFWEAGRTAMAEIERITEELAIDCDLEHVPGYLFAAEGKPLEEEVKSLHEDLKWAREFGFEASFVESAPLVQRPALLFPNQLRFHPLKYLKVLAKAVEGDGSYVFSHTSGSDIDPEKHELQTDRGRIKYGALIAATHVPIQGERGTLAAAFFQTKLAGYSTYAMEAEVATHAAGLFWDTNDPYVYIRIDLHGEKASVIIGGEDHKTGQEEDTEACYRRLENHLRHYFPQAHPRYRWSGQVIETPDGLPFIGEVEARQFLATGFAGNGITLGTFSAMLLRDLITDRANQWTEVFSPRRKRLSSIWEYLRENKDFPTHLVKDHLAPVPSEPPTARCCGEVVKINGKKVAVYRDEHGKKTELSAICPHMGCVVAWNPAEKTWDCPCHGSRFSATGDLLAGPAETGLSSIKHKTEG